ncbi:hypothetical protein DSECCO2_362120 [anaerobic digester metagenome]
MPPLLVAKVEGFPSLVCDRVVVPGGEAEFVGVFAPGVGTAAFGDDAPEERVGQHIGPGRGSGQALGGGDDILASVRGESSLTVEKGEVVAGLRNRRQRFGAVRPARHQLGDSGSRQEAAVDLLREGPERVGDDHAGDRLDQDAVLFGEAIARTHEDSAGLVGSAGFDPGGDESHDLVVQYLPIPGLILVPDDQVDLEPFEPPVGVGLHELADQLDVGDVLDLEQHDGQIPGNRMAPEPGLSPSVLDENARLGPERRIGVDDRSRKPAVELCVGLGRVELPQEHLAVCPGQVEDSVRDAAVLVFFDQAQGLFPCFAHAGDDVQRDGLFWLQDDAAADGHDRVEDGAFSAPERAGEILALPAHGQRVGHGVFASDELHAVRLVGDVDGTHIVHDQHVQHPGRLFAPGARSSGAEDGLLRGNDFGLDKEVAESGVQVVRRGTGQGHLGVAGQVNGPAGPGAVGDAHAAQLDVVFGRHRDLRMGVVIVFPHTEFGPAFREDGFIALRSSARRLVRRGPVFPAVQITQEAKRAPAVAGAVFAPPGHGQILPAAVPAAGIGDHDVVATVGEQLHFRGGRVRAREHADVRALAVLVRPELGQLGCVRIERGGLGDALLQEEHGRLEQRVGSETPLHGAIQQQVGHGEQAHALVMGHEGADHDA